jgi:hypothetical protein
MLQAPDSSAEVEAALNTSRLAEISVATTNADLVIQVLPVAQQHAMPIAASLRARDVCVVVAQNEVGFSATSGQVGLDFTLEYWPRCLQLILNANLTDRRLIRELERGSSTTDMGAK